MPRTGGCTSASSRRGFLSAAMAARVFARWRVCVDTPRALNGNRAGSALCCTPSFPIPPTCVASGSASLRSACFTRRTAAKPGVRAIRTRCDFLPEGERYPEFGQCVHNLTLAPGCSDRLYQQNHCGMYRSDDGGASWRSIENGLPSSFGFPVAAHPRDADTLFFLPLNGDTKGRYPPDARVAVWRSRDGGAHWADGRVGLPRSGAYFGVMRQALATDGLNSAGVYFGTSNGSVYASRDEGETWECIARDLPTISSVETMTAA